MKKPEILAPAGDFEKLQIAVAYGADAVYVGGANFSLRANAKNFGDTELRKAVEYAHERDVRLYAGVNIFAHNEDIKGIENYLCELKEIGVDAVIVADIGVFDIARKIPGLEIHISTQANVTNYRSAMFYRDRGASRVILARELSLEEVREVAKQCGTSEFSTEIFVHGAMCVSYSGRCLISNYLAGRDANRGDCAQPCRWKYFLTEEKRPGLTMPVHEDGRGTYLFNAKDLCMIEYIPELTASGAAAFKIEGRMRSPYYVAAVTRAYRMALDDYFTSESLYKSKINYYLDEIKSASARNLSTGFCFGNNPEAENQADDSLNITQDFLGIVIDYDTETNTALIEQRNKFSAGDRVQFLKGNFSHRITEMADTDGELLGCAPHPRQLVRVKTEFPLEKFDIVRRHRLSF